jgi:hypothetical protein
MNLGILQACVGLSVLLLALGCGGDKTTISPAPGGGGIGPAPPPKPVVQINPWTPPPAGDPVVLGVTLQDTGTHTYFQGVAPNQSHLLIEGTGSGGLAVGSMTIDFNPAGWTTTGSIDLATAATLIRKAEKLKFTVFINVQPASGPSFVITDTEP